MGISEEIEDAKITVEKNEDLKIEAKIWKLTKICVIKFSDHLDRKLSKRGERGIRKRRNEDMVYFWHD